MTTQSGKNNRRMEILFAAFISLFLLSFDAWKVHDGVMYSNEKCHSKFDLYFKRENEEVNENGKNKIKLVSVQRMTCEICKKNTNENIV